MAERLVTFVHISDSHLHPDPAYTQPYAPFSSRPAVTALIAHINALPFPVDFVLHTGDIVDSPETAEHYTEARALLDLLRLPVYVVPGNHDNLRLYQQAFLGRAEADITAHCDAVVEVNGVQLVLLDSHEPEGQDTAGGYLAPEQLDWLAALCAAPDPRPLIVALHHHPLPLEAPWLDTMVLLNGLDLHHTLLMARHRLRGVFYGHIHESVVTVRDGISYYSAQSGWFQTRTWYGAQEPAADITHAPGFNLVTLTTTDTFVRFVRLPL